MPAVSSRPEDSDPNYTLNREEPLEPQANRRAEPQNSETVSVWWGVPRLPPARGCRRSRLLRSRVRGLVPRGVGPAHFALAGACAGPGVGRAAAPQGGPGKTFGGRGPTAPVCGAHALQTSTCVLGGVLLSHTLASAVPSALGVLASGFGMGPGVKPSRYDHRDDQTGNTSTGRQQSLFTMLTTTRPAKAVGQGVLAGVCVGWWVGREPHSGRKQKLDVNTHHTRWCVCCVCVGQLVPVSSNPYRSSTPGLSTQ